MLRLINWVILPIIAFFDIIIFGVSVDHMSFIASVYLVLNMPKIPPGSSNSWMDDMPMC